MVTLMVEKATIIAQALAAAAVASCPISTDAAASRMPYIPVNEHQAKLL